MPPIISEGGAGAHDERVAGRTGCNERGVEAVRQREHGNEDADGAGDAEDGDDSGSPAGADAAEIVGHWDVADKRREQAERGYPAMTSNAAIASSGYHNAADNFSRHFRLS